MKTRFAPLTHMVLATVFTFAASAVAAEDCPDFYRFVDFGLQGNDGVLYRGGPLLRAENFAEDRLLLEDQTECLSVWPTLTDGRGNPMPVVSTIAYDPAAIGAGITELKVRTVEGTTAAATQSATSYRRRLEEPDATVTRGDTFVCVATALTPHVACQLVSPYDTDAPLIVYCHDQSCRLPVLAMDDRIFVSARWETDVHYVNDPDAGAASMSEIVQHIYDFMSPLSSSFQ
ncbi:hypothetical protein Q4555_07615 [Octadecabacter sp. 1_MG-2023]|uniref:hypothetical protein n=1 Tax=unclassified Octadecabacter TaxID=196158 RepID=UPI001C0A4E01|nr:MULTISPECIES: hypothetical protein [unclassified Octadecabacter]MBU2994180.1 hypothetical protein [Octadecabacter sp. B2R22]MDO6734531.1 hypothetical protein [Octadecabacter sp. 1_MG-2023]